MYVVLSYLHFPLYLSLVRSECFLPFLTAECYFRGETPLWFVGRNRNTLFRRLLGIEDQTIMTEPLTYRTTLKELKQITVRRAGYEPAISVFESPKADLRNQVPTRLARGKVQRWGGRGLSKLKTGAAFGSFVWNDRVQIEREISISLVIEPEGSALLCVCPANLSHVYLFAVLTIQFRKILTFFLILKVPTL